MYETKREKSAGYGRRPRRPKAGVLSRWRRKLPLEALFWSLGLVAVATIDPHGAPLISLCPLDALGASFCPGCGLGHAVAYLARGELGASIQAHPLGIPAVFILGGHVASLLHSNPLVGSRDLSS